MEATLKTPSLIAVIASLTILETLIGVQSKADLLKIVEDQERQGVNYASECQRLGLTAQYVGDSGTDGHYFRIENDRVLRAVLCDTGSTSGKPGVKRWETVGRLNQMVTQRCELGGTIDNQWAIQQGRLVFIERLDNCKSDLWTLNQSAFVKGTARPIKWYCYNYIGYNPNKLAQDCSYNIVSTSSGGNSSGRGSGSSVQNFFKGLFSR